MVLWDDLAWWDGGGREGSLRGREDMYIYD